MIINVIKQEGRTTEFTDTEDNRTTKIVNWLYQHYCSNCGTSVDDMEFIGETGYYARTVTMKCKCGKIVKYYG